MQILKKIHTIWSILWLATTFLCCYPLMFIGALHPSLHRLTHYMNKVWGITFFVGIGLIFKKIGRVQSKAPVIYCANHTSYLDIPLLFLTIPGFFMIIGKAELAKVPLFGFVFKRVYITVNRKNAKNAYDSFKKCGEAIDRGVSVVFYPEGTIPNHDAPKMGRFKDGSFKLAIEKKVPLIPVTMPYNWIIFPDYGSRLVTIKRPTTIIHDAIETKNMQVSDIDGLKERTYQIIQAEIEKYNS